jgi:hypothetical protein
MKFLLATAPAAVDPYAFGTRDLVGLIFIGVAIVVIWLWFLHLQGLTERPAKVKPPDQMQ